MNDLIWLLAYMMAGVVWSLYNHDEDDSPGAVFLYLFCWPLTMVSIATFWLSHNIIAIVDVLFELMGGQE